jgi:hypothetical protein
LGTKVAKEMSADELGSDWTDTYSGIGRMKMPEGGFVRWQNPTYAGTYGHASATCNVCGNVTTISQGETISHGDPRLCEHMGGASVRVVSKEQEGGYESG